MNFFKNLVKPLEMHEHWKDKMLFRNYFNPLCVCFAKKVYDHDAKYPFRDAALSLNVCPPWCVLADYYFRLRTNRCVSVQVAVGHGTWFLKQCSSMHVFKGPNIVHSKGQIISEQIYGILKFSKKSNEIFPGFLP